MAELTDELARAIAGLDESAVSSLVKERLAQGVVPLDIVAGMQEGMVEVGRLFESGEYYLSELIMVGEIMKAAMADLEPRLGGEAVAHKGTIVIGTVKGDIHDLGKNIVVMLLKGAGYNVIDVGIDVPPAGFVQAVKEHGAGLLALSVLLTSCQVSLKDTVVAVRDAGLDTKILIGGNYVDDKVREYSGADFSSTAASDGVKIAAQVFA